MDLIDEEDDLTVTVHYFPDHSLKSFLKLSLILCTGDKRAEIKRIYLPALQVFRHVAVHYLLRYTLGNGCLSHSRFSYQYRIVLCSSAQDLKYSSYLLIPADDRIKFSLRSLLIEIDRKSAEIFKLIFCHKSKV